MLIIEIFNPGLYGESRKKTHKSRKTKIFSSVSLLFLMLSKDRKKMSTVLGKNKRKKENKEMTKNIKQH